MTSPSSDRPASAGHWYTQAGEPAYEVKGKSGQMRPTTLADARKHKLVPSVTSIISCQHRPGLESWKIDQAIMAALTLPRHPDEAEAAWLLRVKSDARETARKAAERGTQIHAWVQQGLEGRLTDKEGVRYYDAARNALEAELGAVAWVCEAAFAHPLGFGGKCDLYALAPDTLLDIKTTEKDLSKVALYREHHQQLAAYRLGLHMPEDTRCGILWVSTNAQAQIDWVQEDELQSGLRQFDALLHYWRESRGYWP